MPQADLHENVDLSLVIPVFNEQDSVVPLWHEIREAVEPTGLSFEAIFVDDGSTDAGAERMSRLCGTDPRVKLAKLVRNFGQTAAMSAGIELACGRIIIPLDADRQNDPAGIPSLVNEIRKGYDVVSGWRKKRRDNAVLRRLPTYFANRLISRVTGVRLHDYGCSMKAYKAEYIKDVRLYGQMHRFIPVYCAWQGARIGEIEVLHRPRTTGQAKYGIDRTFRVILDLIVIQLLHRYRSQPMHLFGRFAYAMFALAAMMLLTGVFVGIKYGGLLPFLNVSGIGLVLGCLGVVSIMGGLLAELQMRTHFEGSNQRPYQIAALTNFDAKRNITPPAPSADTSHEQTRPAD